MELQKYEKIEFSNYWNEDTHLMTYLNKDAFNLWSINYTIALVNTENKNIVIKYKLPETRLCFGIMTCPEKNIFIYCHCNYINNNASIIIEIYKIIDNTINKLREFVIISGHTCGNTDGILQRMGINMFNIAWGDLTNSDEISFFSFNIDEYESIQIIEDFEMNYDFINYYFISKDVVVQSYIISNSNNNFEICLKNCIKDNFFFIIENYELPYIHTCSYMTEVESTILEFGIFNNKTLCLVRIKLENRIDVLHNEYYGIDVLMDIDTNKVIFISPKFTYDDCDFSVKSSIYFKDELPMIWTNKL